MTYFRTISAWIVAALITSLATSFVSSQYVLSALTEVGAHISINDRFEMIVSDLAILQALLPIVAFSFLIGFFVAFWCNKVLPGKRQFLFGIAGACSIVCALLIMSWIFNLMPIAGARTSTGLFLIGLCGTLGGVIFTWLTRVSHSPT